MRFPDLDSQTMHFAVETHFSRLSARHIAIATIGTESVGSMIRPVVPQYDSSAGIGLHEKN